MEYHGVNPVKFPLYLKELEFRYNHRDRDLFADLLQVLVGYRFVACTEESPSFLIAMHVKDAGQNGSQPIEKAVKNLKYAINPYDFFCIS